MKKESMEVITRQRGPHQWPTLTLELDFPFNPEFSDRLKQLVPRGAWCFDYDGTKKWYVLPEFAEPVVRLAYEHFPLVYLTNEAGETVEVKTGWRRPQQASLL